MNSQVVLDTSVAISWILPDEHQEATLLLRSGAIENPAMRILVPPIFWSEVTNVLTMAIRRSRITQSFAEQALDALQNFGIAEYHVRPQDSLTLAISMQMSAYDAQYLVLAQDTSAPLWTLDKRLQQAAKKQGLPTEPEM